MRSAFLRTHWQQPAQLLTASISSSNVPSRMRRSQPFGKQRISAMYSPRPGLRNPFLKSRDLKSRAQLCAQPCTSCRWPAARQAAPTQRPRINTPSGPSPGRNTREHYQRLSSFYIYIRVGLNTLPPRDPPLCCTQAPAATRTVRCRACGRPCGSSSCQPADTSRR